MAECSSKGTQTQIVASYEKGATETEIKCKLEGEMIGIKTLVGVILMELSRKTDTDVVEIAAECAVRGKLAFFRVKYGR